MIDSGDIAWLASKLQEPQGASQEEMDYALQCAVLKGSVDIVETLQQYGARLTCFAFITAIKRGDPTLFATFLDHGWDINSTEYELPAVT